MFRYMFALLLVNTCSHTLGIPVQQQNASQNAVSSLLAGLANLCENTFLVTQINSKLDYCNVLVQQFNEKQFECLIFYDVNSQLCEAVAGSKLVVNEDSLDKINKAEDVDKLCSVAKDWQVTGIKEYPSYQATVEKVFQNQVTCVKVCGVDDIISQDSNFFCNYYKWGMEMLHQRVSTAPTQVKSDPIILPGQETLVDTNQTIAEQFEVNKPNVIKNNTVLNINKTPKDTIVLLPSSEKIEAAVQNAVTHLATTSAHVASANSNIQQSGPETDAVVQSNPSSHIDKGIKPEDNAPVDGIVPKNNAHDSYALDKPSAAADAQAGIAGPLENDILANKPNDKPKKVPVPETEDYAGNIDSEEGLADGQGGDDSDDPAPVPILTDMDVVKNDLEETNSAAQHVKTPLTFNGEREFFPNTMNDGFTDDDDHFFPFFLTAVILVVVLYVLYHNKNKVSKVLLGLIVEGRQPGRRRNSRGHAYRRLDTLEQAMSTNSAAPPSKIIY